MQIIITGASRGLGFSIAEAFATEGNDLFLTSRNEVKLYQALESLMSRLLIRSLRQNPDLLQEGSVDSGNWVLGGTRTDILINSAGTFEPDRVIDEPDGKLENMLQVNLLSAYYLTRVFLPGMMERKSGHIFNISSIAALQAYPNGGSYSISKFALTGFSKNLRWELKPYSIKVTCIYQVQYIPILGNQCVKPERIMKPSILLIPLLRFQTSQLSGRPGNQTARRGFINE
jgi:short-subunit dehydrogenase